MSSLEKCLFKLFIYLLINEGIVFYIFWVKSLIRHMIYRYWLHLWLVFSFSQ